MHSLQRRFRCAWFESCEHCHLTSRGQHRYLGFIPAGVDRSPWTSCSSLH